MSSPDLSVVIPTYRSAGFIGACLESVHSGSLDVEVIAVDNASPDDTVGTIRRVRPDAAVVEMGRNAGFAAAVNEGVRHARGRNVLLLNPDTVVRPNALDAMAALLDTDTAVGVVAPRLLNIDGTDQATARAFPTPAAAIFGRRSVLTRLFPGNRWSRRFLIGLDHDSDERFPVDWVSGAALMSPRALFAELGGFDEGFFMHFEDTDWCHRVKDAKRSVMCEPAAEIVHLEGGCRQGWPAEQVRHFHYGAYRYWRKHHLTGPRVVLRPLVAAALAARAIAVLSTNQLKNSRRRASMPAAAVRG